MDRKQKDQLRILLNARKRADKVLAERKAAQEAQLERKEHIAANRELIHQFMEDFTRRAESCGILALVRQAAAARNGCVTTQMSCYLDFGTHTSRLHRTVMTYKDCVLRPSHLAIFIDWDEGKEKREAEIRYNRNGAVTFHHSPLPIFPIIWRKYPQVLDRMLAGAMAHPRPQELEKRLRECE